MYDPLQRQEYIFKFTASEVTRFNNYYIAKIQKITLLTDIWEKTKDFLNIKDKIDLVSNIGTPKIKVKLFKESVVGWKS